MASITALHLAIKQAQTQRQKCQQQLNTGEDILSQLDDELTRLLEKRLPEIDSALQGTYRLLKPLVDQEARLTATFKLCNRLRELSTLAGGEAREGSTVTEDNVVSLLDKLAKLTEGLEQIYQEAPFCLRTLDALGTATDRLTSLLLGSFKEFLEANDVTHIIPKAIAAHRHLFPITLAEGTLTSGDRVQAAFVEVRGRSLADTVKDKLTELAQDSSQLAPLVALIQGQLRPLERQMVMELFGENPESSVIVDSILRPTETLILELVDRLCRSWAAGIQTASAPATSRRDFTSSLAIFGILQDIAQNCIDPTAIEIVGEEDLTKKIIRKLTLVGKRLLAEFPSWLERYQLGGDQVAATILSRATVLEPTSLTGTVLSVISDHERVVESLLASDFFGGWQSSQVGCFATGSYAQDILNKVKTLIESIALNPVYKKLPTLGLLFRINNYQYLLQNTPATLAGDDFQRTLRAIVGNQSGILIDSWKTISKILLDSVSIGSPKDRFKAFQASFDDFSKHQNGVVMPDAELKRELREGILQVVQPSFEAFYKEHASVCRGITVQNVQRAINELFSG